MGAKLQRSSYSVISGNRPGVQRDASFAGNVRRRGARLLLDNSIPRSMSAETTRRFPNLTDMYACITLRNTDGERRWRRVLSGSMQKRNAF
jgi:hypothetical protein